MEHNRKSQKKKPWRSRVQNISPSKQSMASKVVGATVRAVAKKRLIPTKAPLVLVKSSCQ